MASHVGIGTTNGPMAPAEMQGLLDLGCGLYLVLDVDGAAHQVQAILTRYPDAVIIMRRVGQIGSPPDQIAEELAARARYFADLSGGRVRRWVGWNEVDLEQDWPDPATCARYVADWAPAFRERLAALAPDVIPHFPAFSNEAFYQDPLQWTWLPAARDYPTIDLHRYGNVITPVDAQVRAGLDWFRARRIERNLTGDCFISELNFGLNQPRPDNYGDHLYRAFAAMVDEPACIGGAVFIWRWINPQPGGEALEIYRDESAKAGIRRAVADFRGATPPRDPRPPADPPPLDPLPEDWLVTRGKHLYEPLARRIAAEHGIDPDLFARQIQQESNWNPQAVSPSGAEGLGQLIPTFYPNVDRFDPEANLTAAAQTLRAHLDYWRNRPDDRALALASYNGGRQAMIRWVDAYGWNWRQALTLYPERWPDIAGYGDASKAAEVALYLTKILGSEEGTDMDLDLTGIVDLRGQLPANGDYERRSLAGITGAVVHYTASPAGGTVESIARYQTSAAAAGQTGTGNPFPAIAYHFVVKSDGLPHLAHDLDRRTWHAGNANTTTIGIAYIGSGPPNEAQIRGIARAIVASEKALGRQLAVTGHKDWMPTTCPGDWPRWKGALSAAIENDRKGGSEPDPGPELPAEPVGRITDHLNALWGLSNDFPEPSRQQVRDAVDAIKMALRIP